MNDLDSKTLQRTGTDPDLDQLMYPAQLFERPRDVADDPHLTIEEKRAILASWASDACAVEAAPALRKPPGSPNPVTIDEILETLCALDRSASGGARAARRPDLAARSGGAPGPAGSDLSI